MLQGIQDVLNDVHVWGFKWVIKVSKVSRMLPKSLGSSSWRLGCRIVLLEFSKFTEVHNGRECVYGIGQDAYAPATCQSHL